MSLFLVAFTLPTFAEITNSDHLPDGDGVKITVKIDFGRKSKGCLKIGLCTITTTFEGDLALGQKGGQSATGTAWVSEGRLVVEFNRASMSEATYQTYFGSGEFIMIDSFDLPKNIALSLGLNGYIIEAGQYDVPALRSESNTFTVVF